MADHGIRTSPAIIPLAGQAAVPALEGVKCLNFFAIKRSSHLGKRQKNRNDANIFEKCFSIRSDGKFLGGKSLRIRLKFRRHVKTC